MSTLLAVLIGIIVALVCMLLATFLVGCIQVFCIFYRRRCKHCGHIMKYKGLKESSDESHYLLHCPKCGAWEQIPKEKLFQTLG